MKTKTTRTGLGIALTLVLLLVVGMGLVRGVAYAADGDLDPSFSAGGKVTTDFFGSPDMANGVALQLDGKIVVAGGTEQSGPAQDFALARYNPDGSLDPTFGAGGKVTTEFFGGDDVARDVAIRPDGKIVAVGATQLDGVTHDFAVARYNSDGSLDFTFGAGGRVSIAYSGGSEDVAHSVALQPDGRIVLAGFSGEFGNSQFALARLNFDGNLDPTFDGDGRLTTSLGGSADQAHAVALQPDGKIVAAGYATIGVQYFALARYNPNGSIDPTFGAGGTTTTDFSGGDDAANAVALQPDGKIVAAGYASFGGSNYNFALARYNPDGFLDPSFDGDGTLTTDFAGSVDIASSIAVQSDGKIVAAGRATVGGEDFALTRYFPDGTLDFRVTSNFSGSSDFAGDLAIQPDGKIVAAGSSHNGGNFDFAVARYLAGGTPPPTSTPTATPSATPGSYPLFGDALNAGDGYTEFRSTSGGLGGGSGAWSFYSESPDQGATALLGSSTNSSSGIGVQGTGRSQGVVGLATGTYGTGVYGESSTGYGVLGASAGGFGVVGTSQNSNGVYGSAAGIGGAGVSGTHDDAGPGVSGYSSEGDGVVGQTSAYGRNGVFGVHSGQNGYGVFGWSNGNAGFGVLGMGTGNTGYGVYGYSNSIYGVLGYSRTSYGVFGYSGANLAGFFAGNVRVTGTLSKGAGSFKIDHPLDPENKYLYHSFVESPDMMNVYNGNVTLDGKGEAVVTLPEWFEALNKEFRYQLTAIGAPGPNLYVAEKVKANRFKIAGGSPGMEVSWQVTGIRHDPYAEKNRIPVEENKTGAEKGKYLHPSEWGKPDSLGVDYEQRQQIEHAVPALSKP